MTKPESQNMQPIQTEKILSTCLNGLANRIQGIESSMLIAQELRVPLTIIWPVVPVINIKFTSLFETPPQAIVHELNGWNGYQKLINDFKPDFELDQEFIEADPMIDSYKILRLVSQHRRPMIKTYRRIYFGNKRQQIIKFNQEIEMEINSKVHLSSGAVGVHVRRSDHVYATRTSTNSAFFHLVDCLPSNQNIFLCTDDEDVEHEFRQRYRSRMLTNPKKSRNRDTERGMIEAAIDLALLSRTKLIYGSANSTFSRCASFWGNIPLHIAHKFD